MAELVIVVLILTLRLQAALVRQHRCGHRQECAKWSCVALNCTGAHVWMTDELAYQWWSHA